MKNVLTVFLLFLVSTLEADDLNTTLHSRLEDGYGNNEILKDTMPYLPSVKKGEAIEFLGDLRLRSQTIKTTENEAYEHLLRFRARFGLIANLEDDIDLEFLLASGSGDPVSTNQSFGGAWVGKNIVIDIADVYYSYAYHSFLRAGKMKFPLYRTHKNQLIFDSDLRPEGLFVKHKLFLNTDITAGAFVVANLDETDNRENIYFYATQLVQYIEDFRMTLSYHHFDSLKGRTPTILYNTGDVKNVSKGNTLDESAAYANDYHLAELALQYDLEDVTIGLDTVYNVALTQENFGYNVSLFYGNLKNIGDYKLGYFYRDIQKDAVVGAFNDSDFMGGGTDGNGHQLMAGYQLLKNTQLALTYIDTITDQSVDNEHFQRLHLDIKFIFNSQ